jgi:STE24 endopeptidase
MAPPQLAASGEARRADPYTPHLPERAYAYHRANRILFFVGIGWHILGLVLLLRSGVSAEIRDWVEALTRQWRRMSPGDLRSSPRLRAPPFICAGLYYLSYSVVLGLWSLPLGLVGLAVEHWFGFSRESAGLFLKDYALSLCIAQAMIPVVWLGYRFYCRKPATWWLFVWATIVPVSFFVSVVYPVVVSPLYNQYTPLVSGPLRNELLALAAKAGIRNAPVLVEDTSQRTSHVNAYVTGIGPSTRIVLNDTALTQLPNDQIVAMMGHEMGHYVEHHVLIGVAVGALGTGLLLGSIAVIVPRLTARFGRRCRLKGPHDLAAFPLVILTVYVLSLLSEPISSAISRSLEHRADVYGLRTTGLNDATARLMVGFAERDLSDPNPPQLLHFWFGTHPTLLERIALARGFRRRGY